MGKYEKKHKSEFDEIAGVFAQRDRRRAARQQASEDALRSGSAEEPRRIRGGEGYSMDSMREVHEGRAVYDDGAYDSNLRESSSVRRSAAGRSAWGQEELISPAPGGGQPLSAPAAPRRRKKRGFFRVLLRILALLLVLVILGGAVSVLLARMPESDAPIGPRRDGCCAILLCGTDKEGYRTDTMLLLYLDRNRGQARLLSLPRDTMVNRDNPVPKLNGAYGANGMGEKGMDVLMGYVKDLVGYRPDGYMLIDLDCFEELVDLMGGVRFDVPMDMEYNDPTQELYIDLKAGPQKLNGKEAMWLVRFRSGYAMADLERVRVQRDFLAAALDQWASPSKIFRLPGAMSLLMKNTQTDLGYRNLCWIGLTALKCGGSFESDTLPGEPAWVNGGAYYVEDRAAAAKLVNEKYNPYEKEFTADDLHPYGY